MGGTPSSPVPSSSGVLRRREPCVGDVCCDDGDGSPVCKATADGCGCDPNDGDPCGGTFDVCCSKNRRAPACHATAEDCDCAGMEAVCVGTFDVCCDKGDGEQCYSNMGGCN